MLLSLTVILFLGLAGQKIFAAARLPGLVGLVLTGILVGPHFFNLLEPGLLQLSPDIRVLALIIILLRAGLGLNLQVLRRIGFTALKLSVLPAVFEGFAVAALFWYLFRSSWLEGAILGFILAAVSPAVIVPFMLELRERGLGANKEIPAMILASAAVDDVFAITMFSVFLGLAVGTGQAVIKLAWVPVEIAGGVALGLLAGAVLVCLFNRAELKPAEELLALIGSATMVTLLGTAFHLSGLLAVMSLGFILLEKAGVRAFRLEQGLNHLWLAAQLFLFILIGAAVNVPVAWEAGLTGFLIIACGLCFRSLGVLLSTWRSGLDFREQLFCCVANFPKATVQAAIGGLPLAMGLPAGEVILAVAVLSIIVTAPLGAIGLKWLAPRLLKDAAKED